MKRFFGRCLSVALLGATMLVMSQDAKADAVFASGTTLYASTTSKSSAGQTFSLQYYNGNPIGFSSINLDTANFGVDKFTILGAPPQNDPIYQAQAGFTFYAIAADFQVHNNAPNTSYQVGRAPTAPTPATVLNQITEVPFPIYSGAQMSSKAAGAIGFLWTTLDAFTGISNTGKSLFERVTALTGTEASALQLATWKLIYDSYTVDNLSTPLVNERYDLTAGRLVTTGTITAVATLAQEFLNFVKAADTGSPNVFDSDMYDTWALTNNPMFADYLTIATPEPATLAMWGLMGGVGVIFATRFNRKRVQARLA